MLISRLATTVSTANPSSPKSFDTVGLFNAGSSAITASRFGVSTLSLSSTRPRASSAPVSRLSSCSIALRFSGFGVGLGIGDQLGVRHEDRLEDLEPRGAQRAARLGELDDRVGDVGDLRLGGAVAELHVGIDALLGEVAPGELGVLGVHDEPRPEVLDALRGVVGRDREHDLDRARRVLRVQQLAECDDVAVRLLDPVATGDPDVEEALRDVARDLLRPEDADVVDAVGRRSCRGSRRRSCARARGRRLRGAGGSGASSEPLGSTSRSIACLFFSDWSVSRRTREVCGGGRPSRPRYVRPRPPCSLPTHRCAPSPGRGCSW